MRSVFSVSARDVVQLETVGSPGHQRGAAGWRAVTRVLRSCRTLHSTMGGAVADLTNLFLPSDCRICGAPHVVTGLSRPGVGVCETCLHNLACNADLPSTLCSRCGEDIGMESWRFAAARDQAECTMCRLAPPAFERAAAFGSYDNEIRELLHLLKFERRRRVAEQVLGRQLASVIGRLDLPAGTIVVPVPLFKARQRERGFNQAELLARAAIRSLHNGRPQQRLTLRSALERVKDTRQLYRLNPSQRRRNLKGAFLADSSAVRGRQVLLIDDILTTGATARECSAVLRRAGATKVWVVTVARAQPAGVSTSGFVLWDATASRPIFHSSPSSTIVH